jgi:hypothetical protein
MNKEFFISNRSGSFTIINFKEIRRIIELRFERDLYINTQLLKFTLFLKLNQFKDLNNGSLLALMSD